MKVREVKARAPADHFWIKSASRKGWADVYERGVDGQKIVGHMLIANAKRLFGPETRPNRAGRFNIASVAKMLCQGASDQQIADKLGINPTALQQIYATEGLRKAVYQLIGSRLDRLGFEEFEMYDYMDGGWPPLGEASGLEPEAGWHRDIEDRSAVATIAVAIGPTDPRTLHVFWASDRAETAGKMPLVHALTVDPSEWPLQ